MSRRAFFTTLVAGLSLSAAFGAGFFAHRYLPAAPRDFPLLNQAYSILINHGLNPTPPPPDLEYGMIRGMLLEYGDPHTIFLEPAQNELETQNLQGSFGGIGVRLGNDHEGFVVIFPYPGSSAVRAGLLEGDRLLAIDEKTIGPENTIEQIMAYIRGPVGEQVMITIGRPPDYSPIEIILTRDSIPLPSVTWHLEPQEPRLGVLEINIIASTTPDEIQHAVTDLRARGATHFVIDLRNNGGGLLNAGVEISRLFLKEGKIVEQRYRGRETEEFHVEQPGPLSEIPLALLVNQNTASAAEIIAGSLSAHRRAHLIGATTFGKDTIQLVFTLQDGSSVHVTAARWSIPGLELPVEGSGLQPDVLLSPEAANSPQAIEAVIATFFTPTEISP